MYMYIKKCKRNQLHYSVFSKSGKNDIRKHWKISFVFNEIYRGKNIYLRTFLHVKQIVPVPLQCLQPIDDMGRDRNTCSRAKVAFWNLLTICPYSYCQYDSMVYNQALLTEAFQVLYFNSHPSPIYIHFLQVDFLEEVKFARF